MNPVLARWNSLDADADAREALPCCGSEAWASALAAKRPLADEASLLEASAAVWEGLPEAAWHEAFGSHPRIGQKNAAFHATAQSLQWSDQEQSGLSPDDVVKVALDEANRQYEQKFGYIFIVCASGKTSAEILALLEVRLQNDAAAELREAAEQQRQITQNRLRRWLEGS